MKTPRRNFLKASATGMSTAALAGLGSIQAEATQRDQIRKWDYEAAVVALGTDAAGLISARTAYDQGSDALILEKAPETHAGGNILECIVFGRIAGERAAAEKPWA